MAPQAGFEPATNRLTADCSTTELLRNGYLKAWQRPTLAGALAPTTIGAGELNFRVRDGNGCDLSAIVTKPTTLISLLCWLAPRNPSTWNSLVDAGAGLTDANTN
jgi:hypothetical protein